MPDLSSWPRGMRLIVRKERPHPGAQLRFIDVDGLRLTCFATNTKDGQLADLELRHRRRARCEDGIRNARDTRLAQSAPARPDAESDLAGDRPDRPGPAGLDADARPDRRRPPLGRTQAPAPVAVLRRCPARSHRPPPMGSVSPPGGPGPASSPWRSTSCIAFRTQADQPFRLSRQPGPHTGEVEPGAQPTREPSPQPAPAPGKTAPHKHRVPINEPMGTHERRLGHLPAVVGTLVSTRWTGRRLRRTTAAPHPLRRPAMAPVQSYGRRNGSPLRETPWGQDRVPARPSLFVAVYVNDCQILTSRRGSSHNRSTW